MKTVAATGTQQPRRPDEWRRNYIEEMRTRLHLDAAQVVSLNAILDETRSEIHALKSRQKKESDQLREEIRAKQTNKVRAMLTPAQVPEYELFREERERKMKADLAAREQAAKAQSGKAGN